MTGFILAGCLKTAIFNQNKGGADLQVADQVQPGEVAIIESDIIVTKPLSNSVITSPLAVSGQARIGTNSIFFRLKDAFNQTIATSSAVTTPGQADWSYYSASFEFPLPESPIGLLEVYTQNSQAGGEQNLISLPVNFKSYSKKIVKVYFSNINLDPGLLDCSKVHPVDREINFDQTLIAGALEQLLAGLTEPDMKNGFITNIPEEGVKVNKLEIKDGTARVDFNQVLQAGVAGSCRVIAIRSQITETLKQFSEVEEVVISIEGKTRDILQP